MSVSVYSERFFELVGFTGGAGYLVPTGFRAVVRDIDVYASVGLVAPPAHFRFLNISGGTIWLFQVDTDTNASGEWRGRQIFYEGETINLLADAPFDATVSGYLLSLP